MGRREEWEQQGSDDLGNGAPAGDPCEQPMTRGLSRFASLSPPSPMEYRFDHLSLSLFLSRRFVRLALPTQFLVEFGLE